MHFKSNMQYKGNTLLTALSSILVSIGEILAIYMMFMRFESVGEWGFYESILMFGIVTTVYSFSECFARGFDEFHDLVRCGDLDRLLVRPVNIFYQIFGNKIEFSKLARVTLGLVVCIIALVNLSISWTISKILVLIFTFVGGVAVIFGVLLIGASISIFSIEKLEFINIITNGSKELGYYPINVYTKWLRTIFTFIIPVACFNYLPISYLMGYGELPQIVYALSPLIGIIFLIPCILLFRWALTKYQSSGT